MKQRIITMTTDFGLKDPYVGAMKGVILSINPIARMIDISHQVPPGGVQTAARVLMETHPFFPPQTIHLAVIDPGVGGPRRPIIVCARDHLFVGPDNGLFWPIISQDPAVEVIHLTKVTYFRPIVSHTFHGRDIFAPVAAHLSSGVNPRQMGNRINNPVRLGMDRPHQTESTLAGKITTIDRFGNLITNIRQATLTEFLGGQHPVIRLGEWVTTELHNQYTDVTPGTLLALFSSSGYLEIAVNQGRAADAFKEDETAPQGREVVVEKR